MRKDPMQDSGAPESRFSQDEAPLTASEACALLPKRNPASHKGDFGRALIAAGSDRYRGAAALSVHMALRGGAGIVTLASVETVIASVSASLWEATFLPCAETKEGSIAAENAPMLLRECESAQALLIGCGMGRSKDTEALVKAVLTGVQCPVVLDADALNVLQGSVEILKTAACPLVITPHIGEMARLTGILPEKIKKDPKETALRFSRESRAVVVLKDAVTVIAAPDGKIGCIYGLCSGLARGGSGDALTGLLVSFLAQGTPPFEAASAAAVLHAEAGRRCAARRSQSGMRISELADDLCEIFRENGQ